MKVGRKIDSPEYFEAMAEHYGQFIVVCVEFEIPRNVTMKMTEMLIHLRRATQQLRQLRRRKST